MLSSADKNQATDGAVTGKRSAPDAKCEPLSLEAALDLLVCGLLLAGLTLVAQHLQPGLMRGTLPAGLVGGGLCVLWGAWGRRERLCRWGAMATLAPAAGLFVRQAVQSWNASTASEPKGRMVAALMTVMVLCCAGMLATLIWEGKKAIRHE